MAATRGVVRELFAGRELRNCGGLPVVWYNSLAIILYRVQDAELGIERRQVIR